MFIGVIMYCTLAVVPNAETCVVLELWPNTYKTVRDCRADTRTIAAAMAGGRRIMMADCEKAVMKSQPTDHYDTRRADNEYRHEQRRTSR